MYRHLRRAFYSGDVSEFQLLLHAESDTAVDTRERTSSYSKKHSSKDGTSARADNGSAKAKPKGASGLTTPLSRYDINQIDHDGYTLLHLIASSKRDNATDFAKSLLAHPLVDVYIQDRESGWTALHRALYAGNVAIAYEIIWCDFGKDHGRPRRSGDLLRIKDHEKNTPFDLYISSIGAYEPIAGGLVHLPPEDQPSSLLQDLGFFGDEDDYKNRDWSKDRLDAIATIGPVAPTPRDEEVYFFGSNKNVTLGFADGGDRQYPERINLPITSQSSQYLGLPAILEDDFRAINDVSLAKYHSAVITDEPSSNLYLCGHGTGGRLGTGGEDTRLNFVRIDGGALRGVKVTAVALAEDHTLALSDNGDVFSWGTNANRQLGQPPLADGDDTQADGKGDHKYLLPKRISSLKREMILGLATSRTHSIAFTRCQVFGWGRNVGQFGLSRSESTEFVSSPKQVMKTEEVTILDVATTSSATCLLLSSQEVILLTDYKTLRVDIRSEAAGQNQAASYDSSGRLLLPAVRPKLVAGEETFTYLSQHGQIFNITPRGAAAFSSSDSQPVKTPYKVQCIWSPATMHMGATDVSTDSDGGVILVTRAKTAWRRLRRRQVKYGGSMEAKHFKYIKIAGINRITSARASGFGAYALIREASADIKRATAKRDQVQTVLDELSPLQAFFKEDVFLLTQEDQQQHRKRRGNWQSLQQEMIEFFKPMLKDSTLGHSLVISSRSCDLSIPAHISILMAQNRALSIVFSKAEKSGEHHIPGLLRLTRESDGPARLLLEKMSFFGLITFVDKLYRAPENDRCWSPSKAPFWPRYQNSDKESHELEHALEKATSLTADQKTHKRFRDAMAEAIQRPDYFDDGDTIVVLADDEIRVHRAIMQARSPFFRTMLGTSAQQWARLGADSLKGADSPVRIDLTQFELATFQPVLEFIYCSHERFLEDRSFENTDAAVEFVLGVLQVADFLLVDGLSEICQAILCIYTNDRNVTWILNEIAEIKGKMYKTASMAYLCNNLDVLIESGELSDLDEVLLDDLDQFASALQDRARLSRRAHRQDFMERVFERCSDFEIDCDIERQETIRDLTISIQLAEKRARNLQRGAVASGKARPQMASELSASPRGSRPPTDDKRQADKASASPVVFGASPAQGQDLMFDMEDDLLSSSPVNSRARRPSGRADRRPNPPSGRSPDISPLLRPENLSLTSESHLESPAHEAPLHPLVDPVSPQVGLSPWALRGQPSPAVDMRQLIEQDDSSRRTGHASKFWATESGPRERSKISQKERKKLQQTQQQLQESSTRPETPHKPKSLPVYASTPPRSSPWQNMKRVPSTPIDSILAERSQRVSGAADMRQDPSGPASSRKTTPSSPFAASPELPRPRSKGQPSGQPTPSSRTQEQQTNSVSMSTPTPPAIRSIRHIPRPNPFSHESAAGQTSDQSMAAIFSQQQEAKDYKYTQLQQSLKDIQTEQEFTQWWDKEVERHASQQHAAAFGSSDQRRRGKSHGRARAGGGDRRRERSSRGQSQDPSKGAERRENADTKPAASTAGAAAAAAKVESSGKQSGDQGAGSSAANASTKPRGGHSSRRGMNRRGRPSAD